jgi:hypothetical protein
MTTLWRRATLACRLLVESKGCRREIAVYRSYGLSVEPSATGPLLGLGPRGARIGPTRVSWTEFERVEAWPHARCENCLREHGELQTCLVGVLAGVTVLRGSRSEVAPELFARVNVDELWDRFGGPAVDWLEAELQALEAEDLCAADAVRGRLG